MSNLPDNVTPGDLEDAAEGRYSDDPCNFKVKAALTGWGFVYVTASSEEEALEMANRGEYDDFDVMEWEVGEAKSAEPNI